MAKTDLRLNSVFLKNRIAELGIKQWWLAEQIGVDRKTVIRWIQGQVRSIQQENAEKLASILNCTTADLTAEGRLEPLATIEDQKNAAAAIRSSSLFEKLGPIGEWDILESLLKATIVPNLPLNILGELYDKLTIASWRQSKINQAANYNAVTEEIARKTDDRGLLAQALLSKANIFSWRGDTRKSIETYRECLALEAYVEARTRASVRSNLGGVLYESGDLDGGEIEVRRAIELYALDGKPMNFAIAHTHLALIAIERNQFDIAEKELVVAQDFAKADDYRRGVLFATLLEADIAAARGEAVVAQEKFSRAFDGLAKLGIAEGLNFQIGARVHRRLSDYARAEDLCEQGISISSDFPIYQAALYAELASCLRAAGRTDWRDEALHASDLYSRHGCDLRVAHLKKRFDL